MSDWKSLGTVAPTQLTEARLETHHAAQWLARATRAFCTPVPDDSHASLTWDFAAAALITQPVTPNLAIGLRINPFSLVAKTPNGIESLSLFGRTENDVRIWITDLLKEHQLDVSKLDAPGPYTLPKHPLDSGLSYGLAKKEAFEELARYFSNAARLLETVKQKQPKASPVRCWPHHFDIATLVSLDNEDGEEARSIGVGISPGDNTYPEPYFYISPWPYPLNATLPTMPDPAFWHREGFTGVILKSSDLAAIKEGTQQERVTSILQDAIQGCFKLIKG